MGSSVLAPVQERGRVALEHLGLPNRRSDQQREKRKKLHRKFGGNRLSQTMCASWASRAADYRMEHPSPAQTSAPTTKDRSGATDYASRSPRGCFGLVLHRAYRV